MTVCRAQRARLHRPVQEAHKEYNTPWTGHRADLSVQIHTVPRIDRFTRGLLTFAVGI